MKKIFFFILCLSLFVEKISAQSLVLQTLGSLQPYCNESSGLETTDSISVWSHNDSGGKPVLYHFSLSGQLLDSVTVGNASNVDWEDLANNHDGTLFIGDFGNNSCDRTNLKIYRVSTYAMLSGADTIYADTISFSYPDQVAFPPSGANLNFDCEAFIFSGDSLYLFSKNISTSNSSGFTKCYRLPSSPGNYVAELIDSFYTNTYITSADITSDDSSLVLLAYTSVFIFRGFQNHDFFSVTPQVSTFSGLTQKEGVRWKDKNNLFITDERFFGTGGNLYVTDVTTGMNELKGLKKNFTVFPNPSNNLLSIATSNPTNERLSASIFDIYGKEIFTTDILKLPLQLDSRQLAEGVYFISITSSSFKEEIPFTVIH